MLMKAVFFDRDGTLIREVGYLYGGKPDRFFQALEEMKQRLLKLLEKNREPYFDVIMNYGVTQNKEDIDVSKL